MSYRESLPPRVSEGLLRGAGRVARRAAVLVVPERVSAQEPAWVPAYSRRELGSTVDRWKRDCQSMSYGSARQLKLLEALNHPLRSSCLHVRVFSMSVYF